MLTNASVTVCSDLSLDHGKRCDFSLVTGAQGCPAWGRRDGERERDMEGGRKEIRT